VIGPASNTLGATRIRRQHEHTHAGGLGILEPPAAISAERYSRSAAVRARIVGPDRSTVAAASVVGDHPIPGPLVTVTPNSSANALNPRVVPPGPAGWCP